MHKRTAYRLTRDEIEQLIADKVGVPLPDCKFEWHYKQGSTIMEIDDLQINVDQDIRINAAPYDKLFVNSPAPVMLFKEGQR